MHPKSIDLDDSTGPSIIPLRLLFSSARNPRKNYGRGGGEKSSTFQVRLPEDVTVKGKSSPQRMSKEFFQNVHFPGIAG